MESRIWCRDVTSRRWPNVECAGAMVGRDKRAGMVFVERV